MGADHERPARYVFLKDLETSMMIMMIMDYYHHVVEDIARVPLRRK